ncbi:hypothetical protein GCM10022247_64600 [Allokutzneria multivorans]|uniref:HTH cro/C1-type domain-containing protein n=1 Tax=Allokutzneria multivorans TaxID=1142134 RepID=A0ABP7TSC5_9PSEU
MVTVHRWTGQETRALRDALRLSGRDFAAFLGVAHRSVAEWDRRGADITPVQEIQQVLDTALERADSAAKRRFLTSLRSSTASEAAAAPGDLDSWEDDIDRAMICLGRQQFRTARGLLDRWLSRHPEEHVTDVGRRLRGRTLVLLGDLLRDQGQLTGPGGARETYRAAATLFSGLGMSRRLAQVELLLTVVSEMLGNLTVAARHYRVFAEDERLDARDRARARLWIGTALSKAGLHHQAEPFIADAAEAFLDLDEPEDWATAQQKLALTRRGVGDQDRALWHLGLAEQSGVLETPLQRVRLSTARGHLLLSDRATHEEGLVTLDSATSAAEKFGLAHQRRSIAAIRATAS